MTAVAAGATYFVAASALLIAAVLLHQRTRRPGPPRLCDPARIPGEPTGEQLRALYGCCKFCDDLTEMGDPGACDCTSPCGAKWCTAHRQQWHTELGDWRAELAALLEEGEQ